LGQRNLFGTVLREEELELMLREICKAAETLSKDKVGALIVIEKNVPLSAYVESGVPVDGRVTSELIEAIFTPNNPLHDGGLIIQNGRIIAAGCLFPLTQNKDLSRIFGTRHRAAIGLSEETDAIVIIVSEERQDISLVYRNKLYKDLSSEELLLKVREIIKIQKENA
jgi:diadenylate cyclase